MIVKLTEIVRINETNRAPQGVAAYEKREIFVNPEHVVYIREVTRSSSDRMCESLRSQKNTQFSIISLNRGQAGIDITVEGSVEEINRRISSERALLHG